MANNKGQVSIFLLLGVLIIIATFFIFNDQNPADTEIQQSSEASLNFQPVKVYIDTCLRDMAKEALIFTALQGGYYQNPPTYTNYSFISIPYYFYLGDVDFPGIGLIEDEIASYIEDNLPSCIDDFKSLKDLGYDIEYSGINANAKVGLEHVGFSLSYPITIKKGEIVQEMAEFSSTIPLNFKRVHSIVEEILLEQTKDPAYIPIGFITDSAAKNDYTFDLITFDDNSVIYSLVFNETQIFEEPYIFDFAVMYDSSSINQGFIQVELLSMPNMTAAIGQEFTFTVKASKSNVVYSDYTDMFDIDSLTGVINFIPEESQKGLHRVLITAQDINNNQDTKLLNIEIV